jgi:hypothetical protein
MPGGGTRDTLGWLGLAPTFLGVGPGENLNAKEKHVGANVDEVLDRGSTPLTSIDQYRKPVSLASNPGGRVFSFSPILAGSRRD